MLEGCAGAAAADDSPGLSSPDGAPGRTATGALAERFAGIGLEDALDAMGQGQLGHRAALAGTREADLDHTAVHTHQLADAGCDNWIGVDGVTLLAQSRDVIDVDE